MKNVAILGSTGSIGTQALDVCAAIPDQLNVSALAAGSNYELLAQQVRHWKPEVAVLFDEAKFSLFKDAVGASSTRLLRGWNGIFEAATLPSVDVVLGAMLGAAGLRPTLKAIEAKKAIAIANKETLVAAGEIVMRAARENNVALYPVDSEHCALAQCLMGEDMSKVEKLTITASGGPFWNLSKAEIEAVSAKQALKHPTWTMGQKITIDSATLINKGLEMIEARWLFDIPMEKIEATIHRQSIVHSFVSFVDGSVKAQLGVPDMKLPIQWGLLGETRSAGCAPKLDLPTMGTLTFEPEDNERYPSLNLARAAMNMGGTAPCALNAANEIAVAAFLAGHTNFYGVTDCIEKVLERHQNHTSPTLSDVLDVDANSRVIARDLLGI
jgi:1-deoxy-D-xylulose-5-phosphate reductoisomerase